MCSTTVGNPHAAMKMQRRQKNKEKYGQRIRIDISLKTDKWPTRIEKYT